MRGTVELKPRVPDSGTLFFPSPTPAASDDKLLMGVSHRRKLGLWVHGSALEQQQDDQRL